VLAFDYPWLLLGLLLAIPIARRGKVPSVSLPLLDAIALPRTLRQQLLWIPTALRTLAIASLILAAAGPHWGASRITDQTKGRAIELVVDRSSSMSWDDMTLNGHRASRLSTVKQIAGEFLKHRAGDAIGVIAFAAHPQNLSPLVSHREASLAHTIDSIEIARGPEDATAIGDAIVLAASRLRSAEQARGAVFPSKVVIVLTDGQENAGTRRLGDAAQFAASLNIRVYAVAIRPTPTGAQTAEELRDNLASLASTTNGQSVAANDTAALRDFFAEIDRLEPNTIPAETLDGGSNLVPLMLAMALLLIAAEFTLRETWLKITPHVRQIVLLTSAALVVLALLLPNQNEPMRATSLDTVFVLDVSRSMNTEDVGESRLERARALISDLIKRSAHQRFGLVVYAGNASLECPLTDDFAFFATQLRNVSRASVTLGGTRITDAIRFAARTAFDDASPSGRQLILISDGGDESQGVSDALSELAAKGVGFRVAGIGDPVSGGIVPAVLYRGKPVLTKLETASLQRLCQSVARCTYSENSLGSMDEPIFARPMGSSWVALLLALAAAALLAWNRRATAAGLAILLLCGFADPAWQRGDFLAAAESFAKTAKASPNSPEPLYDEALAYYRAGWVTEAGHYLDLAEPLAHGEVLERCHLLRGDLTFRSASGKEASLKHALGIYREVFRNSHDEKIRGIAKYDIEVIKVRLLAGRSGAQQLEPDQSADDDSDQNTSQREQQSAQRQVQLQDRDW
jgi:Ca-activated chloride channel family protein